jgi:hypothetical protein
MLRINPRRGMMVVVVVVVTLALAGAQPAAAQGLGWRETWDWLSSLWNGAGDCGPEIDPNGCSQHQGAVTSADTVDAGFEIDPSGGPSTNGDCGPEIDPSGKCKPSNTASGG